MTDWVKSKPLLGLLGVISAILGSISAFGLVMYCGMDFIGINLAAPFLMLGIGIDDTFVGGCMAIAGYAEKQNRHAITCCTVLPKSQTDSKGLLYRVFCSGGINPADPWNPRDNKDNGLMVFFRDTIGNALNKW